MTIIQVSTPYAPEVKSHHKARHLKKLNIGPFTEYCAELRIKGDVEAFDKVDSALVALSEEAGLELFIAYFNDLYHIAVHYYKEQHDEEAIIAKLTQTLKAELGSEPEHILVGDAHYGDWHSAYEKA